MHSSLTLGILASIATATTPTVAAFLLRPPTTADPRAALTSSSTTTTALFETKKKKKPTRGGSNTKPKKRAAPSRSSSGGGFGAKRFVYAGNITPFEQSPRRIVDPDRVLALPNYAIDGVPKTKDLPRGGIEVKTPEEIVKMKKAGRCAREVLDLAGRAVKPGVTTDEIDRLVHEASIERGAYPSPLNYRGFPKSCCTSVDEVICHGIPDFRPLVAGEIINVDITCFLDGYHGDCSEMFVVGGEEAADDGAKRLIQSTYDSWVQSMNLVRPDVDYNVIGKVIEDHITKGGFSTVHAFCGHGIGSTFHTAPNIYHYTVDQPLGLMQPGHVFTIEPMICEGLASPYFWEDEWTATTADGGRSAQFEHTLLVTEDGVEAMTGKIESSPVQFWERDSEFHTGIWLGTNEAAKVRMGELNDGAKAATTATEASSSAP